MNKQIREGKSAELVLLAEALHEKKISDIADNVVKRKNVKVILIAGPSSSGKTTFAKRLGIQLRLNGLKPIICVGETLDQRESGKQEEIITNQTHLALEGLNENQLQNVMIAYEPIWAIGTGKTATSEDAQKAIKSIRDKICQIYGQNVSDRVIIQYGGSVKSSNAKELFEMSDIDGGLVGGASLKPDEFSKIVNYNK